MLKKTPFNIEKRVEKLSKREILDLTFDLVNAFGQIRSVTTAADLIKDLLTADEIKDLAKRLRIAKLLLKRVSQREIANSLHCSLATVTKVSLWVQGSENTLKEVISRLPTKYKMPKKLPPMPIEFQTPRVLLSTAQYLLSKNQAKNLEKFNQKVEEKRLTDKILRESLKGEFMKPSKRRG